MKFKFLFVLFTIFSSPAAFAQSFELRDFGTEDSGRIEAAFFEASNTRVVIFAHGAIFDKESWYFLAEAFQHQGISALSIDFRGYGNSTVGSSTNKMYDILGAISYLTNQGFTDLNIVGASMGGAAVLAALSSNTVPIHKVVLLAPADGPAMESSSTDKLSIVSENERLFRSVMAIYNTSAKPKEIQIYPGSTHAQHLFKTGVRDELIERIIDFINPVQP